MKINMVGGAFQHDVCSSANNTNKHVEWIKDGSADVSIHIDYGIFHFNSDKKRYAWVAESSVIIPNIVSELKKYYHEIASHYELIFTHDKRLLSLGDKMRFIIPNSVPWVQDRRIYKKSKPVSMIVSDKVGVPGYSYRLNWKEKLTGLVDMYGRGTNPIERKEYGLGEYMFSFAMENDNYPSIWTEKITDCFATGTIPIFWGTPDIGDVFNSDGIIMLTDDFNIKSLTAELYYSKMDAIKDNFKRAIDLPTAEDYIYLNYLS